MKKIIAFVLALLLIAPSIYAADSTINNLTALGEKPATDDEFVLWDSSTGATKKVDFSYMNDFVNVDTYGGITAAVASLGSTAKTVLISTAQTVSADLSIPTTMQLFITRAGSISIDSGITLTINGTVFAPENYQCFTGSGTVTNNHGGFIYGAWTGGSGVTSALIKDEDDLVSDSASHLASQQSIKAYVDTEVAGVNAGKVVQVVNVTDGEYATGATVLPADDTIPQNTEGDEYMSLAITPTSATNNLLIEVVAIGGTASGSTIGGALFQDATVDALAVSIGRADAGVQSSFVLRHYMTAGTTAATTFKFRIGNAGGVAYYFNGLAAARMYGGVSASSITITEIKP